MFGQFLADDAFIIFRYGKTLHLAETWNWNPAGERVEAYTGSLYSAFAIIAELSRISPVVLVKLVGLLSVCAMACLLWRNATSRTLACLATGLLLLNPYTWVHASSGLETPVFTLLLLLLGFLMLECLGVLHPDRPSRLAKLHYLYIVAVLLPFTRPEGGVFSLVAVWLVWRSKRFADRHIPLLTVLLAIATAYFVWRWHYFGYLLPNPFYVKEDHFSASAAMMNLMHNAMLAVALGLVFKFNRIPEYRILVITGAAVMILLYLPHSLAMNYCERFFFQVGFPIFLLGLATIPNATIPSSAAFPAMLACALLTMNPNWPRGVFTWAPTMMNAHVLIGQKLEPFAGTGHTLLVGDAGAMPYFSNWQSYDYLGLCSARVAHRGFTAEYLETIHPDVIVIYSKLPDGPGGIPSAQQDIIGDYMKRSGQYEFVGHAKWTPYYLLEYMRTSQPDADGIRAALQQANQANADFHFSMRDVLNQKYLLSELRIH